MNLKYLIFLYLFLITANASEHLPLSNTVLIPACGFLMGCSKGETESGSENLRYTLGYKKPVINTPVWLMLCKTENLLMKLMDVFMM